METDKTDREQLPGWQALRYRPVGSLQSEAFGKAAFFMLREIHIQNYAVIDNLRVEFHPGLNLLSGETGSGKSILVDALGLALGGRASPDVIRTGTEHATVTAAHSAPPQHGWTHTGWPVPTKQKSSYGVRFRALGKAACW